MKGGALMNPKMLVIAGPTASGKTATSIAMAKRLNGEVISADSMQVYQYMDIGSAKIEPDEMENIPHHLIDVLNPEEAFDVHRFQQLAKEALEGIYSRGHIPIIAGGTGFYIQSLIYDIDFTKTDEDHRIREKVQGFYEREGEKGLHGWLQQVDPKSAEAIHPNNIKRVMRAIEYHMLTGEKLSDHNEKQRSKESPYDVTYVVLTMERQLLYKRIDRRVDIMMDKGLLDEVRLLKSMGFDRTQVSMQGLGYKELLDYLDGEISLDEAIYRIKRDTRHFAKRQLTWFRREKNVHWIEVDALQFDVEAICDEIIKIMK